MKPTSYFHILCILILSTCTLPAATYYISPTGSNTNSGTSSSSPWQTIAKANGTFAAGDIILFQGGQTFSGTLTPANSGTAANRITFGSYGTGRATISSVAAGGVVINGKSYVTIKDLIFRGDWQNATNTAVNNAANTAIGVRIFSTPSNLIFDNINVSGYGSFGFEAQSANSNITITNSDFHNNKDTGIEFRALSGSSKHTNVSITDTRLYRNRGYGTPNSSGNGIRLATANGAMIERCIAYENGKECTTTGGGPVGIWSWLSNNVTIQHCIAYRNGNLGSYDGGGFDIDGGNTNCVMQYNYSFENEGAGYLVAAYSNSSVNNAVIRYNLSINDATKGSGRNQGSIHVWNDATNTATNMQNVYIYNNTVIQTGNSSAGACFQTADGQMTNVKIFNNIFIAGNGRLTTNVKQGTGVTLQGNLYYCLDDASSPRIRWGSTTYTTLAAFQATGQEKLSGSPVGLHTSPALYNVTATPPVLTAWSQALVQLNPWRLTGPSAARNAAIAAATIIGSSSTTTGSGPAISHPGTADLFASALPGTGLDLGMHELASGVVASAINLTPASAVVAINNTQQFTATAVDANGIPVDPQPTFTWSVSGGGTIGSTGLYTAGSNIGGPYTVTATSGALNATASVSIVPPGTLLSYEGFGYTASASITGLTGGTGWRSPNNPSWTSGGTTGTVAPSGLTYTAINPAYTSFAPTGLAGNFGGILQNNRLPAIDTGAAYATAGLKASDGNYIGGSTVSGTLCGSFLVAANSWSLPQMVYGLDSTAGTGTKISIRQTAAGSAISVTDTNGGSIGATGSIPISSLSTTAPNLIVFRYVFNGSGNDTFEVWLNPTSASDTPAISVTSANLIFNNLTLRSVNANGGLVFDEIRLGTSFDIVAPSTANALQSQTITFDAQASRTYGDPAFTLNATASSGLAVSYTSSNTAVATVSGSTVTLVGAGSTTITASQAGNGSYSAAQPVARALTVNPAPTLSTTSAALSGTAVGNAAGNSSVLPGGAWEITGNGAGASGTADNLWFESKSVSGDFQVVARVLSLSGGSAARAGVMVRATGATGSVTAFSTVGSDARFHTGVRAATNGSITGYDPASPAANLPATWVLVERVGNLLRTAVSTDDINWTQLSETNVASLPTSLQVGLFVGSGSAGVTAKATFEAGSFNIVPIVPAGRVGAWDFSEGSGTTTADVNGGGLTATTALGSSFPSWIASGQSGSALGFNGTSQGLGVANNAALNVSSGMTFILWVKPTTLDAGSWVTRTIAMRGRYGWNRVWALEKINSNQFHFWIKALNGGTGGAVVVSSLPPLNQWTHVAATYSSSTGVLALYYNGVLQGSATFPAGTTIGSSSDELRLGTGENAGSYNGQLDGVRLFNRALSASELLSLP